MKLSHVLYIRRHPVSTIFPQLVREKGKMLLKDRRSGRRKMGKRDTKRDNRESRKKSVNDDEEKEHGCRRQEKGRTVGLPQSGTTLSAV